MEERIMRTRISQSFLKDMREYDHKEQCGLLLRAKHVDDQLFDNVDDPGAMELGCYFEYKAFGNLPKIGKIPEAKMMDSGKDKVAAYRMADINALRVRGNPEMGVPGLFEEMGLKVLDKGKRLTLGRFEGTIDVKVMVLKNRKFEDGTRWRKGDKFIIDVKYSGLLYERWSKHGWAWTDQQKAYHGIQAKQYRLISGLPVYFLVFQSNNKQGTSSDIQLFYYPVTEEDLEVHKAEANAMWDRFEVMAKHDLFEALPSLSRCGKCPLRDGCKQKHDWPHPKNVALL